MARKSYPGINIQFPISTLILNRSKIVETRTYPLPPKYVGREMLVIETPGKSGRFKSRIVAKVIFGASFKYKSRADFYRDLKRHRVTQDSPWKWGDKPKWGWPILEIVELKKPKVVKQKIGIVYTSSINCVCFT